MSIRSGTAEFEFSDSDFRRLRDLVYAQTGIALSEAKRELVYSRLARRLRKLKLATFGEYCAAVEGGDTEEMQELTNAITTNLTSFFREDYHFDQLAAEALPEALQVRHATRRLRLWSAGCSTGEEPYSIAIVLREALAHATNWDLRLLATDIDTKVVDAASVGEYQAERLRTVSAERKARWFTRGAGGNFTASEDLKSLITFRRLNLLDPWPMQGPFDVIFCRNVVIYFDKETQRQLFDRMAALQEPGGWLFIGHSENLCNVTRSYKLVGRTVYRRTG